LVALTGIEKVKAHFKGVQHVLSCSFYVQAGSRFCLLCAYKFLRCDPGVTRKLVRGAIRSSEFQLLPTEALRVQSCTDRIKWKYELQRIIEEPKRTETFIPRGSSFVFRIDSEGDATHFLSHRNRTFASGE
jgi:hypothetical protein